MPSIGRSGTLAVVAGDEILALPLAAVREVLRPLPLSRVPHAPPGLLGLSNLRGSVLPVLSLRRLRGSDTGPERADPRARIVVVEGGNADTVGLLVDAVRAGDTAGDATPLDPRELLPAWFAAEREAARVPRPGIAAMRTETVAGSCALLAFTVAGCAYALPLEQLDAVIGDAPPPVPLPDTNPVMLGVVPVRDETLPVLSAARMLRPASVDAGWSGRLLVLRIAGHPAAVAVDRIDGIRRVPYSSIAPVPAVLFRGRIAEARLAGVCRIGNESGLLPLLRADALLHETSMRHLEALSSTMRGRTETEPATLALPAEGERVLVVRLGGNRFALPLAAVREVVRHPDTLSPVPNAPGFLRGAMPLRGRILPVVELGSWLDEAMPDLSPRTKRRIVVVAMGAESIGLAVGATGTLVQLDPARIAAVPGDGNGLFDRVATLPADGSDVDDNTPILLLEPDRLLRLLERAPSVTAS